MKKNRFIKTPIYFILSLGVIAVSLFYAIPSLTGKSEVESEKKGAVQLWNIDTFEGGKGSRTSFLSGIGSAYEKKNKYTYVILSSYTAEGAKIAFESGNYPDMISFGIGSEITEKNLVALDKKDITGSGKGEVSAVAWCRGVYALYAKNENFEGITKENTVLSEGGKNIIAAAMSTSKTLAKAQGCKQEDSVSAYVHFINGEYEYLIGTQRDACRFASRGTQVFIKPIKEFSDLYQYIAVLTKNKDKQEICKNYIRYLLSEESQKKLIHLGMMSVNRNIYSPDFPAQSEMEKISIENTLSPFLLTDQISDMKAAVAAGNGQVLKKLLFNP